MAKTTRKRASSKTLVSQARDALKQAQKSIPADWRKQADKQYKDLRKTVDKQLSRVADRAPRPPDRTPGRLGHDAQARDHSAHALDRRTHALHEGAPDIHRLHDLDPEQRELFELAEQRSQDRGSTHRHRGGPEPRPFF